ncbi:hypothetical protein [Thermogemmatispora sp.]|uniref:hypothetical protein n=1 Tax=Thermogemmatispora sp. TaxID=1968838 RepID=UPI003A1008E5
MITSPEEGETALVIVQERIKRDAVGLQLSLYLLQECSFMLLHDSSHCDRL